MVIEPYNFSRVYTASDTVDIPSINGATIAAVYVGGAGNVTVLNADGTSALFTAVPVGTILPIAPRRIMANGSTGPFTILYRL